MKKILLTGGRGFFASRFAAKYQGQYEILSLKRTDLDVTDERAALKTFAEFQPDYVIHAAAVAATEYCNEHPEIARKINVEGTVNVAKATRAVGGKLVFISTEQIFNGNQNAGPFREDDTPHPDTVYGQNKLEAEGLIKEILDERWIVRFTWLFGMPQEGCGMSGNIFWNTIASMLNNEVIYASPHEFRGMTYVREMVEQMVNLFEAPFGTYHLGSENPMSRYEVVKMIFHELGIASRVSDLLVEDGEKYAEKNRDVRLNCDKAREYGIEFSDTSTAIQRCIADYQLKLK